MNLLGCSEATLAAASVFFLCFYKPIYMCINEEETEQSVMKAEASTILHLPIMLSLMGENNLTIIIFLKKNLVLRVLASS